MDIFSSDLNLAHWGRRQCELQRPREMPEMLAAPPMRVMELHGKDMGKIWAKYGENMGMMGLNINDIDIKERYESQPIDLMVENILGCC